VQEAKKKKTIHQAVIEKTAESWLMTYDAATELAAKEGIAHRDAFCRLAWANSFVYWFNYNLLVELGCRIGFSNAQRALKGFYEKDKKAVKYWKMLADCLRESATRRIKCR